MGPPAAWPEGPTSFVCSRQLPRWPWSFPGGKLATRTPRKKMPRSIPNLTENCELQLEYRIYENIRRDFSWDKPGPTARTAYQRLDFFVDWGSDLCVPQPTKLSNLLTRSAKRKRPNGRNRRGSAREESWRHGCAGSGEKLCVICIRARTTACCEQAGVNCHGVSRRCAEPRSRGVCARATGCRQRRAWPSGRACGG